ncbi:MAG: glycosyltransferase [Planctomycetes bacterium]|nr:glycosyltransferase [Planctomycetota bacterium]
MPTSPIADRATELAARRLLAEPRRVPARSLAALPLIWEGTQFRHHSLAVVNREICSRLIARGHDLEARLYEEHAFDAAAMPRFRRLQARFDQPCREPALVHVRHQWPPRFADFDAPAGVMIQPWEFGSVPRTWIDEMSSRLRELWVPSRYNRQCYIDGGFAADRVRVIPNGVDLERFNPEVAPLRLPTRKAFKFLFVGGTIPRKGIRILLEAYSRAFGPQDDVCLIVKDVGVGGVYEGSTMGSTVRAMAADPARPEILYLDRDLDQDELVALYRAADVLVHPYLGEGFGMPIAEAMACGLPVIVTGLGAALDFCNRDNAWLVSARRLDLAARRVGDLDVCAHPWISEPDLDALVAAMKDAAVSADLRRKRGLAARELIAAEFGWDQVVDLIEERLEALASSAASDEVVALCDRGGLEVRPDLELDEGSAADLHALRELEEGFRPAVAALGAGRLDEAETAFRDLMTRYPELAACHAGLGRVLLLLGRTEEARAALERALAILPGDAATSIDLATAEIAVGAREAATARLEALVAADDLQIPGRLLLARLHRDAARLDEASRLVAEILDFAPDQVEALRLFALIARDLGYRQGFDRARARLEKVAPRSALPSWG